jgi:terminase small subunit-like protein
VDHAIPGHVSAPSRAWLTHLRASYAFSPSEWSLALLAADLRDRVATARRTLAREGLVTTTRSGGLRPHPAAILSRDAIALHAHILGQLGLSGENEERGR